MLVLALILQASSKAGKSVKSKIDSCLLLLPDTRQMYLRYMASSVIQATGAADFKDGHKRGSSLSLETAFKAFALYLRSI